MSNKSKIINTSESEPKVSVIINTCDRGAYLGDTLEGLKQQTYTNFEVVIVNGPSTDDTEDVAKSYNVRYYTAPYNISVSRNVGIKHAAGEILAFIDDDAVPEPNWLNDIVIAYEDSEVGAAGGFVYNADGSDYQFCYGRIDIWGYPETRTDKPYEHNEPRAHYYNINIGTNASYRRTALIETGGFDEEIEYYHDESDVCVRMINKGYKVSQLSNAYVHHKMAPSSRRTNAKTVTNWDAIVKNTIYYGLKNSEGIAPLYKRLLVFLPKELKKFVGMFFLLIRGHYTPVQYVQRNLSLIRAFYRGYKRGLFRKRQLIEGYKFEPQNFKQFIVKDNSKSMNLVLVSQGYPPNNTDGVSRYNHTLAKHLTELGHRVFVVSKTPIEGQHNIYYSEKHWIYFHNPSVYKQERLGFGRLDDLLAHNKSVYKTTEGITKKVDIDAVLVPLWDVEGLALLRNKLAPTAVTLMSPLKKVVETQWYWVDDPSIESVYDLEKYCIENADGVMPISHAIQSTIGDVYNIDWKKIENQKPVEVIPLGVEGQIAIAKTKKSDKGNTISILFVGRFERRKGIDILLQAVKPLLEKHENLQIDLVGNPKIVDENNKMYFKEFEKIHKDAGWFNKIKVHGYVSDSDLANIYEDCDIFVAPSRYESFGLIFIEAMAHGKPVVGTNVGGIPEIITDGENGYLFENENVEQLSSKLSLLIDNKALRDKMGKKGLQILNEKFDAKGMAKNFEGFIREVIKQSDKN